MQYLKQYDNVDEMQEEINMKMTLLVEPRRLRLKVNLLLVFICYLVQIDKSNVSSALYLSEQFYLLVYLPLTTSKSIRQVQGLTPIIMHAFFMTIVFISSYLNFLYCFLFILLFPPMSILLHTSGLTCLL